MVEGFYPGSLKEAVQLKADHPDTRLYAGGTDFMVRHEPCNKLIFLNKLKELQFIWEKGKELWIGSGCTYDILLENDMIPPVLKEAISGIAAPAIRNAGTLGGNICNASPAGDTLPVLYALGARLKLISKEQERIVPIEEFILGVRKLALKDTEILTSIIIPRQEFSRVSYQKVGARKAQALSKLSFVGLAECKDGKVSELRIAFGSVGTTVIRRKDIEKKYLNRSIYEIQGLIEEIKEEYSAFVKPIDDQRSTAAYRKKVCLNLLGDFLKNL